jgi:tetratricopeptide (TPR) repeat protein
MWCKRAASARRTCSVGCLRLAIWLSLLVAALCPGTAAAATCEVWIAKVVSVQGSVETQRAGEAQWQPVRLDDTYCPGDRMRVQEHSRVAIVLPNAAILRLDQKTTITFLSLEKGPTSVLDLLSGAVHFFSRVPRSLKVITPFVNAAVEGTEFFVQVEPEHTFLSVFEGRVAATNAAGSLTLASGQASVVQVGQAPAQRTVVRPRDAVQWALYYPPILDYRPADFQDGTAWQAMVHQSIQFYRQGDLPMAFGSIANVPPDIQDPRFFTYRAALLLTVGRVDAASMDIERALQLDPRHGHAFALQSVIAVVQNQKDKALDLARQAVELEPASAAAQVALSYAQQARFDLHGALASLQKAVKLHPDNALAWARLAELQLSLGQLNKAVDAAQKAVALHPNLARTQTVLGFAFLTQMKTQKAQDAFARAIELEQAAPLPRLGLGLAKIRQGKLQEGRGEIEIAVSLDPNNSLIRSYLGKAYYEEKRDRLARDQFATAKALDPFDPTPWFYDAIRKQTVNRPVEALHDLQRSIELNDNRAVYRSRLLLDEDLAARSATLGRTYNELGFQQLALVEGWKSLHIDPGNYSAHRFLADSYSVLPRHEIARVSELLQSQLLQPINITPVQPRLAESELLILGGTGPAEPSLNEFNPLFLRNRFALQAAAVVGENDTFGDEVVHSGVWGRLSYSLGQFHYETDGFRANDDLKQDIYNVFMQVSLTHNTSVQAEARRTETDRGDRNVRFIPNDFLPNERHERDITSVRLGFHHTVAPGSDVIASAIYHNAEDKLRDQNPIAAVNRTLDDEGYLFEGQHLFRSEGVNLISGVGYLTADRQDTRRVAFVRLPVPPALTVDASDIRHTNLYLYSQVNYLKNLTLTLGVSADFFQEPAVDRDQVNPKVGLVWRLSPWTTLRAAAFRAVSRPLFSDQGYPPKPGHFVSSITYREGLMALSGQGQLIDLR